MEALHEESQSEITSISLPLTLKAKTKAYGKKHGLSMAAVIRLSLNIFLSQNYRETNESHQTTDGTDA